MIIRLLCLIILILALNRDNIRVRMIIGGLGYMIILGPLITIITALAFYHPNN